jgi:carbonic anhydrase/acetyltransferase-like protein (isoleucine patch superfamily)
MNSPNRRGTRSFRPSDERLESRLVMSSHTSVPAEVRAILAAAGGGTPVRPNTPVLPLESAFATATFIDPSVHIVAGKRQTVGQKVYIAPNVTLDSSKGLIIIGSSSTIQDDAMLIANPRNQSGLTGIFVGDNVVIGDGAVVRGPAAIGAKGGAATSIGAGALIDGAIISPGAFVGALARVGPGVNVPTGFRVLPGANVTNDAQASDPTLGKVVKVTSTDTSSSTATKEIADSVALASGYSTLYQGNSATGGAVSAGPVPSAISAAGSTIFFGALNTVLGASSEPGSKNVAFEPASGTPTFLVSDGTQ